MLSRLTGLLILTRVPQASRRLGVLASLFLLLIPAHASAQRIERKPAYPGQWLTSYIPFVATLPNDGPSIEFRARHWQMADYEDRVTHNIAWIGRAAWSPWGGSWLASVGLSAITHVRILNGKDARENVEIDAMSDVAPRRPGDVDLNGVVNLDDLFMLLNAWGVVVPGGPPADFNNNGVIDTDDLFTLINHWGS